MWLRSSGENLQPCRKQREKLKGSALWVYKPLFHKFMYVCTFVHLCGTVSCHG
jgi:hypothetical protein